MRTKEKRRLQNEQETTEKEQVTKWIKSWIFFNIKYSHHHHFYDIDIGWITENEIHSVTPEINAVSICAECSFAYPMFDKKK